MQNNIVSNLTGIPYSYSYRILPLVYDEALSYWEQIVLLTGKINEMINNFNQIQNNWEAGDASTLQAAKQYADTITNALQTDFNRLETEITKQISQLKLEQEIFIVDQQKYFESSFNHLKNQINADLAVLNNDLSELWLSMNYLYYQQDEYYKKTYQALKQYIDDSISLVNGNRIQVQNPVKNTITSLAVALEDVMEYIDTIGSITMQEYDSLYLTMDEYDKKQITLRDYQLRAYFIFFKQLQFGEYFKEVENRFQDVQDQLDDYKESNNIYSVWADKKEQSSKVLQELISNFFGPPTFTEYNSFTENFNQFSTYNNLKLTPKAYAVNGVITYIIANIQSDDMSLIKSKGYLNKNVIVITLEYSLEDSKKDYYITINDNYYKNNMLHSSIIATPIYQNTSPTLYWYTQIEGDKIHLENYNTAQTADTIIVTLIFYESEE